MEYLLMLISILLIAIVLLQSGKAESSGNIMTGANAALFVNRKERGIELVISRLTMLLGILFFVISFIMGF